MQIFQLMIFLILVLINVPLKASHEEEGPAPTNSPDRTAAEYRLFKATKLEKFKMIDPTITQEDKTPEIVLFGEGYIAPHIAAAGNEASMKDQKEWDKKNKTNLAPTMPLGKELRLRLEGVVLEINPKDPTKVFVNLVGRVKELRLGEISREKLERGEPIELDIPKQEKKPLGGFAVFRGGGKISLQWDKTIGELSMSAEGWFSGKVSGMYSASESKKLQGLRGKRAEFDRKRIEILDK